MKKFILTCLAIGIALYLLVLAALYMFQRSVLYIPPRVYLTPAGAELSGAIEVPAPDAPNAPNDIMGWWIPPKDAHAPVVMYFHGNGSTCNDCYGGALHLGCGYGAAQLSYIPCGLSHKRQVSVRRGPFGLSHSNDLDTRHK